MVREGQSHDSRLGRLERRFDIPMVSVLAKKEKQIQQNYRPVIGVHKWFARRPGAVFRALLLSEFGHDGTLRDSYYRSNDLGGLTILDPFMGGGTPLFEANRLGMNVMGCDTNPLAYWIVHQELAPLDRVRFRETAEVVIRGIQRKIGTLYRTTCLECGKTDAVVKYFLWVKRHQCPECGDEFDLSPGPLVAQNARHPRYVYHCPHCHGLTEVEKKPESGVQCGHCHQDFPLQGNAHRNTYECPSCGHSGKYLQEIAENGPPEHRLFAIEYHCHHCKSTHKGRFFKAPDSADLERLAKAQCQLKKLKLPIPDDVIPDGAETKRLHRWGYTRYRELFNDRQLLGLSLLAENIRNVEDDAARQALATVFSDSLRYQNMVCRYDTMALKCQDIFSVHGFPVGLVECENNLIGIPRVGSGGFGHFIEKYDRAKAYCEEPFETTFTPQGRKQLVPIPGERIKARFVRRWPKAPKSRIAWLNARSVASLKLPEACLDGVFTDPPYYDNVQYAELMDFCYVWLRQILGKEVTEFKVASTRSNQELTGNPRLGRGLEYFTSGISIVFSQAASALKPHAPFVFTYHHNDLDAYAPICVALLDAGLLCTSVFAAPAEMGASIHINGTGSSTVDSIIVARRETKVAPAPLDDPKDLERALQSDANDLARGGVNVTQGDVTCLALGLIMASANRRLFDGWIRESESADKLTQVRELQKTIESAMLVPDMIQRVLANTAKIQHEPVQYVMFAKEGG